MTEVMPFRFLDLPPELWNRVYDFAQETAQDPTHPVTHVRRHKDISASTPPNQAAKPLTRQYFPLTQVGRRVREEFRPVYMRPNEVWLLPKDVFPYMRAYIVPFPNPDQLRVGTDIAVTNLVIDLKVLTGPPPGKRLQFEPIHDFVQWSCKTNMRFRYACSPSEWTSPEFNIAMPAALNEMLGQHLDGWKMFAKHIEEVLVNRGIDLKCLIVKFKPTSMAANSEEEKNKPPQLVEFMDTVGFRWLDSELFLAMKHDNEVWCGRALFKGL